MSHPLQCHIRFLTALPEPLRERNRMVWEPRYRKLRLVEHLTRRAAPRTTGRNGGGGPAARAPEVTRGRRGR